ncbi:type VI secretion system protein TssA [Inquilinus sp. Marseille-Q2685]|uniref:type VI secretion system protein TssA n=1 Tax=Inquilinus sp. Marseille-Q2685 TaxID=2866581 RepID=UPI001CE4051C|nr:type VI secretion system protein TssA [Inquilinus sp. Marseille-Q2685]
MLDADQLLQPVSDGDACGEALDYDLGFLELEMASQGKPGQQIGDTTAADEPPDWREVWRLGLELAGRSKDLRIGVLLTRSALSQSGFAGLRQGLELLAGYVEQFWPDLHPRPDAEDGDDQTVRLNTLANLCDPAGLMAEIRQVPLTASRQFGSFTLRDCIEAQRSQPGEIDPASVERAFGDTDPGQLDRAGADLDGALAAAIRLDAGIKQRVDITEAVRFDPLIALLRQGKELVDAHRPSAAPAAEIPEGTAPPTVVLSGEIRDRNDVIGMLDRICRWYRTNEPASPVPALLERAKRLVSKDFMALLLELAPEGAAHYRSIAGLAADESP